LKIKKVSVFSYVFLFFIIDGIKECQKSFSSYFLNFMKKKELQKKSAKKYLFNYNCSTSEDNKNKSLKAKCNSLNEEFSTEGHKHRSLKEKSDSSTEEFSTEETDHYKATEKKKKLPNENISKKPQRKKLNKLA